MKFYELSFYFLYIFMNFDIWDFLYEKYNTTVNCERVKRILNTLLLDTRGTQTFNHIIGKELRMNSLFSSIIGVDSKLYAKGARKRINQ